MSDNDLQLNGEEILIRDENGEFKVLKSGELLPYFPGMSKPQPPKPPAPKSAASQSHDLMMPTGQGRPALQPPVPAIYQPDKAKFYFAPEDEEEVSKLKTPVDNGQVKKYSVDKILLKIIENNNLHGLSVNLRIRLKAAVFAYLRDRRTFIDTSQLFVRSEANGGLSFSAELADKLMVFLKEVKEKIILEKGLVIEEIPLPAQTAPQISEPMVQRPTAPAAPQPPEPIKSAPVAPMPPKPSGNLPQAHTLPDDLKQMTKPPLAPQRSIKEGKVPMADIRKDFRLIGPVEELASISLITYRRLARDPKSQADKVLERVDRLSRDSLAKKAAGIQAWRRSPVYKMYLAVGQASMEHGISVKEVIDRYQAQGKEILSLDEFEAITDLNKKLRF